MVTKLKNLQIDSVDLVDQGAILDEKNKWNLC